MKGGGYYPATGSKVSLSEVSLIRWLPLGYLGSLPLATIGGSGYHLLQCVLLAWLCTPCYMQQAASYCILLYSWLCNRPSILALSLIEDEKSVRGRTYCLPAPK